MLNKHFSLVILNEAEIGYLSYIAIGRIQRKTWCMDPMPELTILSSNLMSTPEPTPTHLRWATLCQSRDLNPMPESTFSPSQVLRIWPQEVTFADTFIKL
jgi:hypothetical protein